MAKGWQARFADVFGVQAPHLVGGDAGAFSISLEHLRLFGESVVDLPTVGVTVIVGANNAGKSTLLREVVNDLSRQPGYPDMPRLILERIDLNTSGEVKDVIAWLGDHSTFVLRADQATFHTSRGAQLHPNNIQHAWQSEDVYLGEIAQAVLHYSHAQDRFAFGGGVEMRASFTDPPVHPLHQLQDSKDLREQLNEISESVFDQRFTLDTLGRTIQLRVGTIDVDVPPVDDISPEYHEAMERLRPLDQQGDGMRGFMGQLLPMVTSSFRIIALDEPEAFLHPPQAYGLGTQIGNLAAAGKLQVIVATHDRSLLAGLLDSGVDVSVVRLQRDDQATHARQLDAARVAELWRDPVLKYTNVLDGLFHRAVVLAEGEADCGFFGAALDIESDSPTANRDLLFVPTGGKDGMPRVAKSLSAVGVPVVATVDLDLLSDVSKLKQLVESLGSDWSEKLADLWKNATNDIRSKTEPVKVSDVQTAIGAVLDGRETEHFTPEIQSAVNAQIRTKGSRWSPVKEYGVAAFKGMARAALVELLAELDGLGVVLVLPGELERLAPEVAVRKGPEWLSAALTAGAHSNTETQAHVARIRQAAADARIRASLTTVSGPGPSPSS